MEDDGSALDGGAKAAFGGGAAASGVSFDGAPVQIRYLTQEASAQSTSSEACLLLFFGAPKVYIL